MGSRRCSCYPSIDQHRHVDDEKGGDGHVLGQVLGHDASSCLRIPAYLQTPKRNGPLLDELMWHAAVAVNATQALGHTRRTRILDQIGTFMNSYDAVRLTNRRASKGHPLEDLSLAPLIRDVNDAVLRHPPKRRFKALKKAYDAEVAKGAEQPDVEAMKAQYTVIRVSSETTTRIGSNGEPYRRAVNSAINAFEDIGETQRSQIAQRLNACARNPLGFPTAFLPTDWTMEDLLMLCFLGWLRGIVFCDLFLVICGYVVVPDKLGWVVLFCAWIVAFAKHSRNGRFSGLKYVFTSRLSPNRPTLMAKLDHARPSGTNPDGRLVEDDEGVISGAAKMTPQSWKTNKSLGSLPSSITNGLVSPSTRSCVSCARTRSSTSAARKSKTSSVGPKHSRRTILTPSKTMAGSGQRRRLDANANAAIDGARGERGGQLWAERMSTMVMMG